MDAKWKILGLDLLLAGSISGCATGLLIPDSTVCIPEEAVWSPDGTVLAVAVGIHDAYGLDLRGMNLYAVTADGTRIERLSEGWSPAWSPDGTRIAFTSARDRSLEVYVMNADGSEPTNLTNLSDTTGFWTLRPVKSLFLDTSPAWSPDGRRIAFSSDRDDGHQEIYVMNADGTGPTRLTHERRVDDSPAWSPDGTRIAFTSMRDGNAEIYLMNTDGSGVTNLTRNRADDRRPDWSPDGSRIAFESDRDGNEEIYVMNADGSGVERRTDHRMPDTHPHWSPDGSRIAFTGWRGRGQEIWLMNADGSQLTALTRLYATETVTPMGVCRVRDGSEE